MGFDLAVLSGAKPFEPDEAAEIYSRLAAGEDWEVLLQPDPNVDRFVQDITGQWPEIDDVGPGEADRCPWSQAFELSPAHVLTAMVWSRVDDVAPVYIQTALRHSLHVFDPQSGLLHSPGQAPRAATLRPPAARTCAKCGKPIEPADLTAEDPAGGGVFHLGCMLGGWPPGPN
jgi:hypothetical protein